MSIHTDISQDDWAAFVRFVTRSASKGMSGRLEVWLVALAVSLALGVPFWLAGIPLHVPSLMAGLLAGLFGVVALSRLRMRRIGPAPDGIILGLRQVSLDDDGLRETSERHEAVFRWQAVRNTEVTDQHIFVMLDKNSAVIVPRRVFPSESEREQFVREVHRRSGRAMT